MPTRAMTSAEISLPGTAEPVKVRERIALLADTVDIVGLTDNHAGQADVAARRRQALAREQGVRTIVHVSCRDRNRLALRSQVLGAAARSAPRACSASRAIPPATRRRCAT